MNESLRQEILGRIAWLKDKGDGGTPPCADLRITELKEVLGLLDNRVQEIKQEIAVEDWAWFFYTELGYRITDSDEDKELLKKAMIGLFDKVLGRLK